MGVACSPRVWVDGCGPTWGRALALGLSSDAGLQRSRLGMYVE